VAHASGIKQIDEVLWLRPGAHFVAAAATRLATFLSWGKSACLKDEGICPSKNNMLLIAYYLLLGELSIDITINP
jgi:hypothetical protein